MITYEVRLDATGSEETFFWADTDLDYAGSIWSKEEIEPGTSIKAYSNIQLGKIYRNSYQLIIVLCYICLRYYHAQRDKTTQRLCL